MKKNSEVQRPEWKKALRIDRRKIFEVNGSAAKVFPLLCPVLEYDWLPGWKCVMMYSQSGVAEKDCVFSTKEAAGMTMMWTLITYEPNRLVEYVMAAGKNVMVRLSIGLADLEPGRVTLDWHMVFTGTTALGRMIVSKRFDEAGFEKMMTDRQRELNHYLATGRMVGL